MKRIMNNLILFFIILFLIIPLVYGNNNVIEFRNDSSGSESFNCSYQPTIVVPQQKYLLQSKDPDVWVGQSREWNGVERNDMLQWAIEIEYDSADEYCVAPSTISQATAARPISAPISRIDRPALGRRK